MTRRRRRRADPPEAEVSLDPLIARREEVIDRAAEELGVLPRARNGDGRVPSPSNVADVGLRQADRFGDGHLGDTREGDRGGYTIGWRRGTKNGQLLLGSIQDTTIREERRRSARTHGCAHIRNTRRSGGFSPRCRRRVSRMWAIEPAPGHPVRGQGRRQWPTPGLRTRRRLLGRRLADASRRERRRVRDPLLMNTRNDDVDPDTRASTGTTSKLLVDRRVPLPSSVSYRSATRRRRGSRGRMPPPRSARRTATPSTTAAPALRNTMSTGTAKG